MGENKTTFSQDAVAELSNGDIIVPESPAELQFLQYVADNDSLTTEQQDRIARLGTLFEPTKFDLSFDTKRRKQYPTDLDPQLRKMIREV